MIWPIIARCATASGLRHFTVQEAPTSSCLMLYVFERHQPFPALVGKLCRSEAAVKEGHAEAAALDDLDCVAPQLGIPRLIAQGELSQGFFYVQSGLPGDPWVVHETSDSYKIELLERAMEWLTAFQSRVSRYGDGADAMADMLDLCATALEYPTAAERELLSEGERLLPELEGVPIGAVHGDFWPGNILEHEGRLGVVDWGGFHMGGATEDLFQFIAALASHYSADAKPTDVAGQYWDGYFGGSPVCVAGRKVVLQILRRQEIGIENLRSQFISSLIWQLTRKTFGNHAAWREFVARYVDAGMPVPFSQLWSEGEMESTAADPTVDQTRAEEPVNASR